MSEWQKGKPKESGYYEVRWKQNVFGRVINYKGRSFFDGKKWYRKWVIEWKPLEEGK